MEPILDELTGGTTASGLSYAVASPADPNAAQPGIGTQLQDLLLVASGNRPVEVSSSALPIWVLPCVGIAFIIWLFKN